MRLRIQCLPACLPAYLPEYLHIYLPTCLPTYLNTCLAFFFPTASRGCDISWRGVVGSDCPAFVSVLRGLGKRCTPADSGALVGVIDDTKQRRYVDVCVGLPGNALDGHVSDGCANGS